MITKDEFLDWKRSPVTIAIFSSMVERINDGAKELAGSAGVNPLEDRFKCGMIRAYQEVMSVEFDELEGASDNA